MNFHNRRFPVLLIISVYCGTQSYASNDTVVLLDPDITPWLPTLVEDLALRQDKVMRSTAKQDFKPTPVGYVVNSGSMGRPPTGNREVTETDLYLLGAIEKLVYRVDLMEKRLRRTEELIYHVMEGANTQREDPCPANFTRVARNCYHFSDRQYNWKSASSMCKSLASNLLELESRDEYTELVTYLQSDPYLRGVEFWTGGLNPGLLWIWSNSAQPVLPKRPTSRPEDSVIGSGRCLKLGYNGTAKLYQYYGAECSIRQRYICEHEENSTIRALKRIHKALRHDDDDDTM